MKKNMLRNRNNGKHLSLRKNTYSVLRLRKLLLVG